MTPTPEADLDLVDRYHQGDLTPEEVTSLRDRITNDPEFAALARVQEKLWRAGGPSPAERTEQNAFADKFKERQRARRVVKPAPKDRSLPRWVMGVAAALLLCLAAYFLLPSLIGTEEPAVAEAVPHFIPLNRIDARMGGQEDLSAEFATALKAYDTGDYATAAPLLNRPDIVALDSIYLLYGAVANLGLGEEEAAIATLEGLKSTRFEEEYGGALFYYLGIGYLEVGNQERAEITIRKASNITSPFQMNSNIILDLIK